MEHKFEGNTLEITLPEKIIINNTKALQEEIFGLIDQHPGAAIEFECDKVKYISSAGLRIFLSIKKKKKVNDITMKNVHEEINKIFGLTGLDNIFTIRLPIPNCDITGCDKLFAGVTGSMYSKGGGVMVKVYREDMTLQEVEKELDMTKKSLALGIPTVITFMIVRCKTSYGILFEEIQGDSVADRLRKNPERLEEYATQFAQFTKGLHSTEIMPGSLPDIKQRYRDWLDQMQGRIGASTWNKMNGLVEGMGACNTFIHGDLSLENVFFVDDELTLMDMGSCGYGHPVFDLQALYASLVGIELDDPGYCERTFNLDATICRRFWKTFIREYIHSETAVVDDRMVAEVDEKQFLVKETSLNQLLTQCYILKEQVLNGLAS